MSIDCLSVGILVADHGCAPVDHVPAAGELVLADRLELAIGGCASNTAVDLARVGVQVAVVGCVGDDVLGRFVTDTLDAAGVDTGSVRRLLGVGTSATLIVNVAGQDRRFIHTVGANGRFTAADIPIDRLRAAKVLYVGGYLLMPALDAKELADVFRQARRLGVKTVLDIVLPGPGDHWPRLAPVLPETDIFLPNADEAAAITGLADPRAQAEHFLAAGAGAAVITCGGQGTVLATRIGVRLSAGVYPTNYVGGTGAGDAFDAGYIAGLLAGHDERGCLAWGSALGASCVRSISATEGVFTRREAEAFLREQRLKIEEW
ncbi:MAG: carbohydrate kinase family protein [Planctomycetia bacterium]|nr:carbohydrate kinase family protein [Planctomycetia bacterium]